MNALAVFDHYVSGRLCLTLLHSIRQRYHCPSSSSKDKTFLGRCAPQQETLPLGEERNKIGRQFGSVSPLG